MGGEKMEKGNSTKIIAIFALVLAVTGLSVGFAAYTSTLNISANANVEVSGAEWDVGFASSGTMAPLTGTPTSINGTGTTSAGSVNLLKYTLSQGTAATLSNTSTSTVSYAFQIKNAGSINANLASITSAGLSCAYNSSAQSRVLEQDATPNTGKQVTAETGTIEPTDCRTMFNATLTIDGTSYNLNDLSNETFSGSIAAGASKDATLTISGTGTTPTNIPTGDFVVTLGATTVVYTSASGS